MQNITPQQIDTAFENLPDEISDIIFYLEIDNTIKKICSDYNLPENISEKILVAVNFVLLDLANTDDLIQEVYELFPGDTTIADAILSQIDSQILVPFSEKVEILASSDSEPLGKKLDTTSTNQLADSYHEPISGDSPSVVEALLHNKTTADIIPASKGFFDSINKEKDELKKKQEEQEQIKKQEEYASRLASSVVPKTNFGYNPSPIIDGNSVNLKGMSKPTPNVPNLTKVSATEKAEATNTTDLRNIEIKKLYTEIPEEKNTLPKSTFEFNLAEKSAGVKISEPPVMGKILKPEPEKAVGGYIKREFRINNEAKQGIAEPLNESVANNNKPRAKNQEAIDKLSQYFSGKKDLNSKSTVQNQSLQFIKKQAPTPPGEIPKAPLANTNPNLTASTQPDTTLPVNSDAYREPI